MSTRSDALAARFTEANEAFAAVVAQYSDADWSAISEAEGWSVGVIAHHVAANHLLIVEETGWLMSGTLPANIIELSDQFNAEHARTYANCTRDETVDLLRRNGEVAADFVRNLRDEQLDTSAPIPFFGDVRWTAQEWIENILIGHITMHVPSIEAATTVHGHAHA
jgi:hypothetical protein